MRNDTNSSFVQETALSNTPLRRCSAREWHDEVDVECDGLKGWERGRVPASRKPPPALHKTARYPVLIRLPRPIITLHLATLPRHNNPSNLSTSIPSTGQLPYNHNHQCRMVTGLKLVHNSSCLPAFPTCKSSAKPTCLNSPKRQSYQSKPLLSFLNHPFLVFLVNMMAADSFATAAMKV